MKGGTAPPPPLIDQDVFADDGGEAQGAVFAEVVAVAVEGLAIVEERAMVLYAMRGQDGSVFQIVMPVRQIHEDRLVFGALALCIIAVDSGVQIVLVAGEHGVPDMPFRVHLMT